MFHLKGAFEETIAFKTTFLQKLVGTNPNRPHMFRRACQGICVMMSLKNPRQRSSLN